MSDETPDLLKVRDGLSNYVAMYTGLRQQFIDGGWSPEGAEAMVLEMLRKSS